MVEQNFKMMNINPYLVFQYPSVAASLVCYPYQIKCIVNELFRVLSQY